MPSRDPFRIHDDQFDHTPTPAPWGPTIVFWLVVVGALLFSHWFGGLRS